MLRVMPDKPLKSPSYSAVYLTAALSKHDGDDSEKILQGTLIAILDARSRAASPTQFVELADVALKALDERLQS